jgi:hypothetical protein
MSCLVRPGRQALIYSEKARFIPFLIKLNLQCPIEGPLQPVIWRAGIRPLLDPTRKFSSSKGKLWLARTINIWRVGPATTTLQCVTPLITRRPTRGLPRSIGRSHFSGRFSHIQPIPNKWDNSYPYLWARRGITWTANRSIPRSLLNSEFRQSVATAPGRSPSEPRSSNFGDAIFQVLRFVG